MRTDIERARLSAKEATLIEAARRELPAREVSAPGPVSIGIPSAAPTPEIPARGPAPDRAGAGAAPRDTAARAAALIQLEKEENIRRRKRTRQIALATSTVFIVAAGLWLGATLFHWGAIL